MKRIQILLVFLIVTFVSNATDYYFSNAGSDGAAGTSSGAPFQSIAKFNSILANPGDHFYFRRGDTFYGTLTPPRNGNSGSQLIIDAYGTGALPIITGAVTISSWSSIGSGRYEATVAGNPASVNMVTVNDVFQPIGRWPKSNASNSGYLTLQSHTNTSITSNAISGALSYTGGEVVIRKNHWIIDRPTITAQTSTTVTFSTAGNYSPTDGFGFFFQNHPNACTAIGDWSYSSSTHKITMYFGGADPSGYIVKVANTNVVASLTGRSYITIQNISFQSGNSNTYEQMSGSNITLDGCEIKFSGVNAVRLETPVTFFTIKNSLISYANSGGIYAHYASNLLIQNIDMNNVGMQAGMGNSGDITYYGISDVAKNSIIELCRLQSIGYVGINFTGSPGYGDNIIVRKCIIDGACKVKDDGAGIYAAYAQGAASYVMRYIEDCIVLNCGGAGSGAGGANGQAHGFYLDDHAADVTVRRNTSKANTGAGYYFHDATRITVSDNRSFGNSEAEVKMLQDLSNEPIRNLNMSNNIWFSTSSVQDYQHFCLRFNSTTSDIAQWGTWDNNFYCRPLSGEGQAIATRTNASQSPATDFFGTLVQWKALSGKDANSKSTPIPVTDINRLRFEYNATSSPVTVNFPGTSYMTVAGVVYNGSIQIPAWSSRILIQTTATTNILPTVSAGSPITITSPANSVALTGTSNDPDGQIVGREWSKLLGGTSTISTPAAQSTQVTGLSTGLYTFQYKVTDNNAGFSTSTVNVTVNPPVGTNAPPVAHAGSDFSITLPTNIAAFVGSGSDVDGTVNSYSWTKVSGPGGTITNPSSASTNLTGISEGVYILQLTVTDDDGSVGVDQVTLTVKKPVTTNNSWYLLLRRIFRNYTP